MAATVDAAATAAADVAAASICVHCLKRGEIWEW